MRNYSNQYKNYHENLQAQSINRKKSPIYNSNDFMGVYGNNTVKRENNKKENLFDGMIDIFIYQLAIVLLMLVTVFYLKYSSNTETVESYNNIKAVINDTTYIESDENNKSFDISSTIKKVNNYIKLKLSEDKLSL